MIFNATGGGGGTGSIALDTITLTSQPTTKDYKVGQSFSKAGMTVQANYTNGATKTIEDYSVSPSGPLSFGVDHVTISYTEDGVTATQRIDITVTRTEIPIPTQSVQLTYNGLAQSPSWNNYDPTKMDIAGLEEKTNAGSYQVTFTPHEEYSWPGADHTVKTVTWTIKRKAVPVPTLTSSLIYTGSPQAPTWNNYDQTAMSMTGGEAKTDADTYTAIFTLNDNHDWSTGGHDPKSIQWTIAKANCDLKLTPAKITLSPSLMSTTISVSRKGDGAITARSDAPTVFSAVAANTTITVTSVNKTTGDGNVLVSVAATKNYNGVTDQKVPVTAEFVPAKAELNAMSWKDIKTVIEAGLASDYWKVGDTKTITINGTVAGFAFTNYQVDVFILGFNHNSAIEGTNRVHFGIGKKNGKLIALCDGNYNSSGSGAGFRMNTSNDNGGGWNASYMRKSVLGGDKNPASPTAGTLLAALPPDLLAVMSMTTKYTDNTGHSSNLEANVTETQDSLFTLAEWEIFGARYYANEYEQKKQQQYEYFKTGAGKDASGRIAYRHTAESSAVWWWLRSASYHTSGSFCCVNTAGTCTTTGAYYSGGLLPGFSI